jgi:hypothetical protein
MIIIIQTTAAVGYIITTAARLWCIVPSLITMHTVTMMEGRMVRRVTAAGQMLLWTIK